MAKKNSGLFIHFHSFTVLLVVAVMLFATSALVLANNRGNKNPTDNGFDELGYNKTARLFEGVADGVDGTLDGKAYGDPTYGKDHLKMKWNAEWDRGNEEGWTNGPYGAWIDNNWNGQVPEGSGEVWQYRIKWVGDCGADGTPTGDGGYCLWGEFEVLMSHGTVANEHFWDAHAIPAGFGR